MAQKKFSELEAGTVDGTSIFAQTKTEDGSLVSKSASSTSLAGYIGTSHQFTGLNTNAKTLVRAINEAAQSGGGASVIQLTQAEYTVLSTAKKMNGSIYKITDNAKIYCLDKAYHPVEECTVAEYNQKTSAQQNDGTIYIKTDAETTAADIPYSAGVSVADKIDDVESTILTVHSKTVSVTFDGSGEGSVSVANIDHIIAVEDMMSDSGIYPAYIPYRTRGGGWRIKTLNRNNLNFSSTGLTSSTRTVKIYYLA